MKKKLIEFVLLAAMAFLFVFDCGMLSGCQSPPQNVAYKAEGVIITTVDSAMKAWRDYVISHPETPQSQRNAVHSAYDKYYSAQMIAKTALEAWTAAKDQEDAIEKQKEWMRVSESVPDASAALINLVKGLIK